MIVHREDPLVVGWSSAVDDPIAWVEGFGWVGREFDPAAAATALGRGVPGLVDERVVGDKRAWWLDADK